jgi:uncharacterized protein YndB with AHSA1/START domain
MSTTDRIEKKVLLRAPRDRVWSAISDARQFGTWFGVEFDGPFAAGAAMRGRITPTQVDPEVAKMQEPHTGKAFDITVDRIEPPKLFSFRWQLTITESGFDKIPLERRAKAFAANEGGWTHQAELIAKYLAGAART